jgi:phospholipid/cholesterol/gamma-HCH transport system substrate-binding protein
MKNKVNYILVGVFVLALGTALIAGVLWLGAGGPGHAYKLYAVYMTESVSGLSRDGAVKYRGVDVGRVREVSLDPHNLERVRLLLEIEQDTPIKVDTIATLESQGLTGLAYINLIGGSQDAATLKAEPGQHYPVIRSQPSIWGRLDRSLGELVDNLIDASHQLKTLLNPDNQRVLVDTLHNLEKLSSALAGRADTITASLDDLAKAMRNARQASAGLPDLVQRLQHSAQALEHMADEISATGTAVRDTVAARDRDLQRFTGSTLPEAAAMVGELRQAAENFRRLSDTLQRDPSTLLYGAKPPPPGPGE